jgi:hypothetical protein
MKRRKSSPELTRIHSRLNPYRLIVFKSGETE